MSTLIDEEIEEAIRELLTWDSRVDKSEVVVTVEDRTAFLSGTVDSAAERKAVLEDVSSVARVENIIDELILRNYVERTDEELKEAVRHALARDISVDAEPVSVEAKKGEVALSGRVDSFAQKNAAEDVAWWTPGVTNVISHLEVEDDIPADLKD